MSTCLQVGEEFSGKLHVVSCYAPMRAARREAKVAFFQDIECFLSSVPSGEMYLILGDFNARVVLGISEGATWVWSHQ